MDREKNSTASFFFSKNQFQMILRNDLKKKIDRNRIDFRFLLKPRITELFILILSKFITVKTYKND